MGKKLFDCLVSDVSVVQIVDLCEGKVEVESPVLMWAIDQMAVQKVYHWAQLPNDYERFFFTRDFRMSPRALFMFPRAFPGYFPGCFRTSFSVFVSTFLQHHSE